MRKNNKKGFTLVELLVVIAIIAIIAAVAVPVTISQISKAKIGTAVDEANQVKTNVANVITELATASTPTIQADTLASGLSEFYTEMKQVEIITVMKDGDNLVISLITKVQAPNTFDTTKGYVGIDKTQKTAAKYKLVSTGGSSSTNEDANVKVSVQFTMKGKGVTVTGNNDTTALIAINWTGNAFAAYTIPAGE